MKLTTFIENGTFYKGNTHTHSKHSDGWLTPEELAKAYREAGYQFLCITDHRIYREYPELCTDDFILIPGVELDGTWGSEPGCFHRLHHVVALAPSTCTFKHDERYEVRSTDGEGISAQPIIDFAREHGALPIYAHPLWSHANAEEILQLENYVGMEIFNNVCRGMGIGYSENYYDFMIWRKKPLFCFASDDMHRPDLMFGGFIVVKAERLERDAILDAIVRGSFYASEGPEIHDFYVEDGKAHVSCSPCREIHFVPSGGLMTSRIEENAVLTEAEHPVRGNNSVRVVIVDDHGKRAWSQPIYFNLEN